MFGKETGASTEKYGLLYTQMIHRVVDLTSSKFLSIERQLRPALIL